MLFQTVDASVPRAGHLPVSPVPWPASAPPSCSHLLRSQTSPSKHTVPSLLLSREDNGPAQEHALSSCLW